MQYDVTIGIPVYNVEKYIRQTMDSVLTQTFESIEFLICDDCGSDSSIDIIREYQREHPRGKDIRIIRQPQNKGVGEARNMIISEVRSKFIYFMDADDTITPNAIELLYNNAIRYNAQIVYGSYERIHQMEDNVIIPFHYPNLQFFEENEFANYVYRSYDGIQANTWNFLVDINVYRNNNLKYLPINFWEDFTFTMDLPTYITRAVLISDITYSYYCRYGTLSNYQKRDSIEKDEIIKTIHSLDIIKRNSDRIADKPYFTKRMEKVMFTCFYMACNIIKHRDIINPLFSDKEIRNILRSPLSLRKTLMMNPKSIKCIFLFILEILPPAFSVFVIKKLGVFKGVI